MEKWREEIEEAWEAFVEKQKLTKEYPSDYSYLLAKHAFHVAANKAYVLGLRDGDARRTTVIQVALGLTAIEEIE